MAASSPLPVPTLDERRLIHRYAQLEQVRLHYVELTPRARPDAPLVVLLHGFPEFWYAWRNQLGPLCDAGFRVIAPDMRGYNLSDKPAGVANYRVEALADDVAQLIEAVGASKATVVGHDWGGVVAWWFGMRHPGLTERLVAMNAPHPGHQLSMMSDPDQLRRSWYMLYFNVPVLPERRIGKDGFAAVRRVFERQSQRPGAFTETDLDRYVESWSAGHTSAMLNYYRSLLRRNPFALRKQLRPINAPVQVLWGVEDRHLAVQYAQPPVKWVWDVRVDFVEEASHWLHAERPERVNALLLDFLRPRRN